MSLVVNMHQRRTVASGRQNQDPNTPVAAEKERAPKTPKLERSIQQVLNHKGNTSGRARQMVLAALQSQQAAAEKTPPAASRASPAGKSSGRSAKKNSEGARSAVVPVELTGNKISISDNRKRPHEHEETRAPLTALNGTTSIRLESDFTSDWTGESPAKPSPRDGTRVYRKKARTGETPPTPPLTSSSRRKESRAASPPPPPVILSNSPHVRSRRQGVKGASTPPPPRSESKRSLVRNEKASLPVVSKPIAEYVAEKESLQPVRRQLMSPSKAESGSHGLPNVRNNLEDSNALAVLKDLDTQLLDVEPQSSTFFVTKNPVVKVPEFKAQPIFSFLPKSEGTQVLDTEIQTSFSLIPKSIRRLHGLMNLGNTCYMNVIVQVLCNLPSFVNGMERFFGPIVNQNALEGSESFPDIESVHAALLKVFRDLKRAERFETVNPTLLKQAFAQHQSSFCGSIQQDAHEFFCSLIDHVQEDVSAALKKQYSNEADRPKLEMFCPTTQNFSCAVKNNLTCAGCGNVSSVEETYRDFSLALPEDERTDESKNCSLESLLDLYFQETTMSRKCGKCGAEDTKAKAQILKLPHVLVLQLKRLHMDRDIPCTKVSAPVKFTSRLDIGPWCAQDKQKFWSPSTESSDRVEPTTSTSENDLRTSSQGNLASSSESASQDAPSTWTTTSSSAELNTCYKLHGVVNHLGQNAFGGHFVTDIFDPEADRWLRCDDSLVTDVSEESVFANVREGYMFFYVHEAVSSKASD
ncbi:hypothetical protein M758_12G093100 [Ceratodon purpureus]|nr:hypothetical protein M758_12G093100 [Ceratodon purpureus]